MNSTKHLFRQNVTSELFMKTSVISVRSPQRKVVVNVLPESHPTQSLQRILIFSLLVYATKLFLSSFRSGMNFYQNSNNFNV